MAEQLFRDYESSASETQRRGVMEIAIRELAKHAALEELAVYPLAREVLPDGAELVEQQLRGHTAIKNTLNALDHLPAGAPQERELAGRLRAEVTEHVQQQESRMLPALREAVDQQALDELGHYLDEAKRTAPTRPHIHAPDTPPVLTLAAPVAALLDRFRDRLQGRPQT
jgi:hypothetical protein